MFITRVLHSPDRRSAVWWGGVLQKGVESEWATASSRLTGRVWWPRPMRRSSIFFLVQLERYSNTITLPSDSIFMSQCMQLKCSHIVMDSASCQWLFLLHLRSTWRPCLLPCTACWRLRNSPSTSEPPLTSLSFTLTHSVTFHTIIRLFTNLLHRI